jgi:hypothetical protein
MDGKVIGFSDSGPEPRKFAIVEVAVKHTLVVPTSGLEVIEKQDSI